MNNPVIENSTGESSPNNFRPLYPFFDPARNRHGKLYKRLCLLFSTICFGFSIYLSFAPLAKIGNVSIGSAVEIVVETFKKGTESSQFLGLNIIGIAFVMCLLSILHVFHFYQPFGLYPKAKRQPGWKEWIGSIIGISVLLIAVRLFGANTFEYYGVRMVVPYFAVILPLLPDTVFFFISAVSVIKRRRAGETFEKPEPIRHLKARIITLIVGPLVLIGIVAYAIYDVNEKSDLKHSINDVIQSYRNCEVDVWFENGYISVGEALESSINVNSAKNLYIDARSNASVWEERCAQNTLWYDAKIAELTEEKNQLKPKEVSSNNQASIEKSFKEYLEKVTELEAKIEYLRDAKRELSAQYVVIKFSPLSSDGVKEVLSYTYNRNPEYHDENGYKWGYTDNSIASRILGESITLSKTVFDKGSDFGEEKIVATIRYSDGSKKSSFITPENTSELNAASGGRHFIEWSDEWGQYEAEITISD